MKSTIATIGVLILQASISLAEAPNEIKNWSEGHLFAEGPLQSVREQLALVCQLKTENGKLMVDREAWEHAAKDYQKNNLQQDNGAGNIQKQGANGANAQPIMKLNRLVIGDPGSSPPLVMLFQNIQDQVGPAGRGWSSGGFGNDSQWHAEFSGQSLNGEVMVTSAESKLVLSECRPPARKFEFEMTKGPALQIRLSNADGDIVSFRQSESGRFTILAIIEDKIFADPADSFAALVQRHRPIMESDVVPALSKLGIHLTLPNDPDKAASSKP